MANNVTSRARSKVGMKETSTEVAGLFDGGSFSLTAANDS